MVIGVSGKIGSGKDTVAQIIQYLIARKGDIRDIKIQTAEFLGLNKGNWEAICNRQNFKIVRFADKVKDCVSLILGCTREQLESREFKEKELGEEWWYYKLERDGGYGTQLFPYSEGKPKNVSGYKLVKPTVRHFMQLLGTDCGRNIIHPNIWVNATMAEYKPLMTGHIEVIDFSKNTREREKVSKDYPLEYPNWIATDVRFPNELKAVKDRGGITIRVNRPYSTVVGQGNGNWATFSDTQFHPSETSLDSATFDFIINNDRDIEHLISEVKKILEKSNII